MAVLPRVMPDEAASVTRSVATPRNAHASTRTSPNEPIPRGNRKVTDRDPGSDKPEANATDIADYQVFDFAFYGEQNRSPDDVVTSTGLKIVDYAEPAELLVRALRFDGFVAAHATTRPVTLLWPRTRPAAHHRCLFVFINRGTIEFKGDAVTIPPAPSGVGVVFPGDTPVEICITTDAELILFSFDKDAIAPVEVSPALITNISPRSPVFRAAYSYLYGAVRSPQSQGSASAHVLRELTRDVARAISLESLRATSQDDVVTRARAVIEENFASPSFNIVDITAQLQLSRRSLERAFAKRGTSLSNEIRARRARHAHHLSHTDPDMLLAEVARHSGFNSTEVLRRALLRYFPRPSTVRIEH